MSLILLGKHVFCTYTRQDHLHALVNSSIDAFFNLSSVETEHQHLSNRVQLKGKDAQCLCSQLNVLYGTFVQFETSLHGICASDFVTDRWIERISSTVNSGNANRADIRGTGSA